MKQLYSNNAKTTLSVGISATDLTLQVTDATRFPTIGTNEYFMVTLEVGNQVEVVKVSSVSGNLLNIASIADRGAEGTTALVFPAASRVEMRVTKGTLEYLSRNLALIGSINNLVAPKDSFNTGYVCGTLDSYGTPISVVTKTSTTWGFISHTIIQTLSSTTANTTTTLNTTGVNLSGVSSGRYVVHITSGIYSGYVRDISSYTSTSITWTSALGSAPANGVTFEILQSNSSMLIDIQSVSDDSVVMPLILGGI